MAPRRERLVSGVRRSASPWRNPWGRWCLALVIGGIVMAAFGFDPFSGYAGLFRYAFLSEFNLSVTILNSVPLVFTGLAVAFAFRCGLFNIGAEGQFIIGGLVAGWLGTLIAWPMVITVPLLLVVGCWPGPCGHYCPGC